jgi:hypothetical protein
MPEEKARLHRVKAQASLNIDINVPMYLICKYCISLIISQFFIHSIGISKD